MSEIRLTHLFELAVASGDALSVRRFQATERISDLYRIDIVAMSQNQDVDLDAVVGKRARFTVGRGSEVATSRTWTGIVTELRQTAVEETGLATYALTLAPALWLLTQRRNYRVFQRLSEVEIAEKILSEWGITPELSLSDTYDKREYRVQYGESDYAFLCRMLEDAGVSFYFATEDDETKLRLHDAPNREDPRPPLRFLDKPWMRDPDYVTEVQVGRRVRPGKVTMRDHDYRRAASYQLGGSTASGGDEDMLEQYHYVPGAFVYESGKGGDTPIADDKGGFRADDGEGAALAQRRLDAQRATKKQVSFKTGAVDLAPGVVFSVAFHPKSELAPEKKLLVVASSMSGTHDSEWTHACESVPAAERFRPDLETPRPRVHGVESATVVGPPGEEIHTDEFGRARVQFRWDRLGGRDDKSSCWIPVSQGWAGTGYGLINLARVGQEVIVDFLGGDPDRPIIVGRVHTNTEKVPYPLPANKTQSGWKSQSSPGGGGYNEMMFEDAAGRELVRMQAQKDLKKLVKHDENVTIGNNRGKSVGNDDRLSVGNNRTRLVGSNESVTVGSNQSVTVGSNHTVTVGANEAIAVGASQSVAVGASQSVAVTANRSITVGGNETTTVSGDRSVTIEGNDGLTVSGTQKIQVTGAQRTAYDATYDLAVSSNHTAVVGGSHVVSVTGKQELASAVSQTLEAPTQTLSSTNLGISASATASLSSAEVSVKGSTIKIDGATTAIHAGDLAVDSGVVTVNAGGVISMHAAVIKLNS